MSPEPSDVPLSKKLTAGIETDSACTALVLDQGANDRW